MIAYLFLKEFCTDWITLFQFFWFSMERLLNFLNQNIGSWNIRLSKICLEDWLRSPQICKCSTSKLKKIFSARCWRPGLFKIVSNMLSVRQLFFKWKLVIMFNEFILISFGIFFMLIHLQDCCVWFQDRPFQIFSWTVNNVDLLSRILWQTWQV